MSGNQQSRNAAPKSILKKPTVSPEERNRSLAIHHANLIQQRKDLENTIFGAIEALLDYPSSATKDPLRPALKDASDVKEMLKPFQPSDFDSLVEERNIDKKCGYVLCPRPHRMENTTAKFRILRGRGVVATEELEKWCSDTCAKHALYVRVQLSETPAWERTEWTDHNLQLYAEKESLAASAQRTDEVESLAKDLNQLAIERGDKHASAYRSDLLAIKVEENSPSGRAPKPPTMNDGAGSSKHGAIEGYVPRTGAGGNGQDEQMADYSDEESEDIMDTI